MDLPAPMLPSTGRLPLGRPGWAYEFKWDGIRVMVGIRDGGYRVQTRHGRDVTAQFPELAGLVDVVDDAILDGELVVFDEEQIDFGAVVGRLRARPGKADQRPVSLMAFDLLRLDGTDLRDRAYEQRRELLERLGLRDERWVVPVAFADGAATVEASLAHGLEGVVAKRLSSRYASGRRSRDWVKSRHRIIIDAVVVGWTPRADEGITLLLGETARHGRPVFIGRCQAPRELIDVLAPLAVRTAPVAVPDATARTQWVRPELGVEVAAPARTPDGRLRQPQLVRVRLDRLA